MSLQIYNWITFHVSINICAWQRCDYVLAIYLLKLFWNKHSWIIKRKRASSDDNNYVSRNFHGLSSTYGTNITTVVIGLMVWTGLMLEISWKTERKQITQSYTWSAYASSYEMRASHKQIILVVLITIIRVVFGWLSAIK